MKIRIPEGKRCMDCPFYHFQFIDDFPDHQCNLFFKSWSKSDLKIRECLKEFGNGGEFELVKKEEI